MKKQHTQATAARLFSEKFPFSSFSFLFLAVIAVNTVKIVMGSDHGGFELKEKLKKWLEKKGHSVEDIGCYSKESVDYPDYGAKVARAVVGKNRIGIAICGTGIGICMAANKIKGIRAALIYNEFTGKMAKEHNNANVVCLGGRTTRFAQAKKAVNAFLKAGFQGGRHARRVRKIMALEK